MNKMNKIIFGIVFCIMLISLTAGATDTESVSDIFKLNEIVNYAKPCFTNGSYCSASAICNYTIYKPDKSIIVNNNLSTNRGVDHNVSFAVDTLGVHTANVVCCDGSAGCGSETFYFEVTGSGLNNTFGFYILILILSFGLIVLGFSMGDAPITILGSFGLYFVALYILFNGINGIQDLVTTWAIGIIILGVATYISIRSTYELIVD